MIRLVSQWSRLALALAVTLWLANWAAVQIEPDHGPFFLIVAAGFLIATLPNWTRLRN